MRGDRNNFIAGSAGSPFILDYPERRSAAGQVRPARGRGLRPKGPPRGEKVRCLWQLRDPSVIPAYPNAPTPEASGRPRLRPVKNHGRNTEEKSISIIYLSHFRSDIISYALSPRVAPEQLSIVSYFPDLCREAPLKSPTSRRRRRLRASGCRSLHPIRRLISPPVCRLRRPSIFGRGLNGFYRLPR